MQCLYVKTANRFCACVGFSISLLHGQNVNRFINSIFKPSAPAYTYLCLFCLHIYAVYLRSYANIAVEAAHADNGLLFMSLNNVLNNTSMREHDDTICTYL